MLWQCSGEAVMGRRGGGGHHTQHARHHRSQLGETDAHFVRCIKPNGAQKPASFDTPLVLSQLRSSGAS